MNDLWQQAIENAKSISEIEDKIAMELFGCKYDDLEYDDKELVTFEAHDQL